MIGCKSLFKTCGPIRSHIGLCYDVDAHDIIVVITIRISARFALLSARKYRICILVRKPECTAISRSLRFKVFHTKEAMDVLRKVFRDSKPLHQTQQAGKSYEHVLKISSCSSNKMMIKVRLLEVFKLTKVSGVLS